MLQLFFGGEDQKTIPFKESFFSPFLKIYSLEHIILLHQVHGINGKVVCKKDNLATFQLGNKEGDFLVTNCTKVGIGVLTADCLPLVLYDKKRKVIAVVHAGWRGMVNGIVKNAFTAMQISYKSIAKDIEVFIGPCAKLCCYEVSQDFVRALSNNKIAQITLKQKNKRYYFGMPEYITLELEQLGIARESLHLEDNNCTMCTIGYCSYRTQKGTGNRNITLVSLK